MNKNKQGWGRRRGRRSAMGAEKRTKERHGRRRPKKKGWQSATDWNTDGQEETTQRRGPKDWPATRPPGKEQPGREQGRAAKRRASWTGKFGGTRRQEDKHKEPGQGQPGKKVLAGNGATRTGSSGRAEDRGQPGTKRVKRSGERRVRGGAEKQKNGSPVKENKNKAQEWKREKGTKERLGSKQKRIGKKKERRHGLEKKKPRGNGAPRTGTPGGASGQAHGAWTGASGKQRTQTGKSGAEVQDWNIRGRYGLERSVQHQGKEATAAGRKGEENKNKSKVRRREDTKNQSAEEGGGGVDRVERQPARYEGKRQKAWCLGLGHPRPGGGHKATGHPGLEHPRGCKRTRARSRTTTSGEERARNRATRARTSEGQKPGTGAAK